VKIGVDLRSLEGGAQHRGIGRYATELIQALSQVDHHNEYVFFVSHPKAVPPEFKLHPKFMTSAAHGRGQGWRGVKYARILAITGRPLSVDSYGVDVFFQIDMTQPIRVRSTPVVSVVYDLIPFLYKDMYQKVHLGGYTPGHLIGYSRMRLQWTRYYQWLQRYKDSARIISISEHSKRDLMKFVPGIDPEKIIVTPLAAGGPPPTGAAQSERLKKLGLKHFLFYVGGADPRKGLVAFTKSMEVVWQKHPDTQVVFAGKEVLAEDVPEAVKLRKTAEASSRPKQIKRLGFISDEELGWLYSHAAAFIWPSRYEGFGLPILEAMQAGCPVVTYDNSSLPEVTGTAALLVKDGKSMAPAIIKLLDDESLRKRLIKDGKAQAAKFTWAKTAKATLVALEAAGHSKTGVK